MQSIHVCVLVAIYLEKIKVVGFDIMSKKRKRLMGIVGAIICILLLGIGITIIFVAKYKEEHRYLTYEELEPEQIVLIQETMMVYDNKKYVVVRAVDAEGDAYYSEIPYDEWNGVENFFVNITKGKKTINRIYDEEIEQIYNYILQIDDDAEYVYMAMSVLSPGESKTLYRYQYGIRYKGNGEIEYILYREMTNTGAMYLLDDPKAKDVYYSVGGFL